MSPASRHVLENGGLATYGQVVQATSRVELERAVTAGELVRRGRGRLVLAGVDEAAAIAHGMTAVLGWTSAALWLGWEVLRVPERPHVVVTPKRKVAARDAARVQVHRATLLPEDVRGGVCTAPEITLLHCLRHLPEDEGLAVADSALRAGVTPGTLSRIAVSVGGAGAEKVRRVASRADDRAANPFESALRHLALQVPGLHVVPQRVVVGRRQTVRPDLVDEDLRIVIEADSFRWHGGRADLRRDARRYDLLVAEGWAVLRFAWEDVMFDQAFVLEVLADVVASRRDGRRVV